MGDRDVMMGVASCRGISLRTLAAVLLLALVLSLCLVPAPASAEAASRVSVRLLGWGWCLSYREIGDVELNLAGNMRARPDAPETADLYLRGTLEFSTTDRTDTFDLELRGTKVRSLFFLKEVGGGDEPLVAEFEGTWLDETDYVACQGRLGVPKPEGESGLSAAKPYFFVLGTPNVDVPSRQAGGWTENIEFIIQKGVTCFDVVASRLWYGGAEIKDLLGAVLTQLAAIANGIRNLGIPYIS